MYFQVNGEDMNPDGSAQVGRCPISSTTGSLTVDRIRGGKRSHRARRAAFLRRYPDISVPGNAIRCNVYDIRAGWWGSLPLSQPPPYAHALRRAPVYGHVTSGGPRITTESIIQLLPTFREARPFWPHSCRGIWVVLRYPARRGRGVRLQSASGGTNVNIFHWIRRISFAAPNEIANVSRAASNREQ